LKRRLGKGIKKVIESEIEWVVWKIWKDDQRNQGREKEEKKEGRERERGFKSKSKSQDH